MKKINAGLLLAVCAVLCLATVSSATSGLTVLVVPARYSVLQVAFDVAQQRGPVLVSYQGDAATESPLLHYWNGADWMPLSVDDYVHARFLREMPKTILVVGGEDMVPEVLVSRVSSWCSDVRVIPTIDTPELVNSMASAFSFTPHEWEWFARRYNLQLQDKQAERRHQSWYDRDSYDDKWSDRWHWLHRKYNDPAAEQAPPAFRTSPVSPATPEVYVEEIVIEEVVVEPLVVEPLVVEPLNEPDEDLPAELDVVEEEVDVVEEEVDLYPVK